MMAQLENVKPKKNHSFSLMQKDVVQSDMINLMNMGYEGEFWFGNPS